MLFKVLVLTMVLFSALAEDEEIHFLENGKLKLGVSLAAGGGIFYLSSKDGKNILNTYRPSQFIQQSYYGAADGSKWDGKPWVWNPVQGRATFSKVKILDFKKSPEAVYVKCHPLHWASGEVLSDCVMEQWVILKERIAHIRYRFVYSGNLKHPVKSQEIPAIFLTPEYHRLTFYSGDSPWKGGPVESLTPGWPNKTYKVTEPWVAYVNNGGVGLGVMAPKLKEFTSFRYKKLQSGEESVEDSSYLAPMRKIAIEKGREFVSDIFLTLGTIEDIRIRFGELNQNMSPTKKP